MAVESGGGGGGYNYGAAAAAAVKSAATTAKKTASRSAVRKVTNVGRNVQKAGARAISNRGQTVSSSRNNGQRGAQMSGGQGGSPVGSNRTGTIAPTVPAPPPMSLEQWLARGNDTVFSGQEAAYKRALADYAAQFKNEQDKYGQEYDASLGKVKIDEDTGFKNMQDDYASRGLLQSGVYANALNEFQNSFKTRRDDLARARDAYLADLTNDKTNFEQEQLLALAKAKQDAANRRTATLGL